MINTMTIRIADGKDGKPLTLRDVALEVQALNAYVNPVGKFHTAIPCNPDSETQEGFLGICNTPPTTTEDGSFVSVQVDGYQWIDVGFFPAMPSTFSVIACGQPPVGVFA